MKKHLLYFILLASSAQAESPSRDWNGNYSFPSSSAATVRLLQADLIEKKDGGYYDSFGPVTVWSYSTTTAGTIINSNTEISGDSNRVTTDGTAYNSGNLNGSINLTSNSSVTSSNSGESKLILNQSFIDD